MRSFEILTYLRSTGKVFHSHKIYSTVSEAEKALKTVGFRQATNLPDVWYDEFYFAKIKEVKQ